MRSAAFALCGFAAAWAIAALIYAGAPLVTAGVPVLISIALVALVWNRQQARPRSAVEQRRIGRIIGWASGLEGVGILVGVNLAGWAGRPDLVTSAVAAVVGIHFLPLARLIPFRLYYATGAAIIALSMVGLALVPPTRDIVVCAGSAMVLWLTVARLAFGYSKV